MGDLTNKRRPTVCKEIMHNWGGSIYGQCFDILHVWLKAGTSNCYSYYSKYIKMSDLLNFRQNWMFGPIFLVDFLIDIYWGNLIFSALPQSDPMKQYGCNIHPILSCHPIYMWFAWRHQFSRPFDLVVHSLAKKDCFRPPKMSVELLF